MKIYVDQSGKVEDTSKDTVLAYSNGIQKSLRVSSQIKREIQKEFRNRKQIIDVEYYGHDNTILNYIEMLYIQSSILCPQLRIQRIGNTPPVHYVAYDTYKGKRRPTRTIKKEELLEYLF